MKRIGRLILIALVVVVVTLGFGYVWGSSGRRAIQSTLEDVQQRLDVAEARGLLLEARVNLYNVNFGDASRKFEEAKTPLQRMRTRYAEGGNTESVRRISTALEHVDEAQRLAGKLDQAANSKASEALEAIKVATSQ
jgi:hypothetical protein